MHFLHLYSIKNILFVNSLDYLTNDNNYSFITLLLYARIKLKTLSVKITCFIAQNILHYKLEFVKLTIPFLLKHTRWFSVLPQTHI